MPVRQRRICNSNFRTLRSRLGRSSNQRFTKRCKQTGGKQVWAGADHFPRVHWCSEHRAHVRARAHPRVWRASGYGLPARQLVQLVALETVMLASAAIAVGLLAVFPLVYWFTNVGFELADPIDMGASHSRIIEGCSRPTYWSCR